MQALRCPHRQGCPPARERVDEGVAGAGRFERRAAPDTVPGQRAGAVPPHKSAESANEEARQLATYFVGQIVGSMNRVKPTRQVVFELIEELVDTMESVNTQTKV